MARTKKQLANLVPFKKTEGDVVDPRINTTGLNRGSKWLTTELDEALRQIGEGNKDTYYVLLVKRVMRKAIVDGDMRAIELIWNRIEGGSEEKVDKTLILMITGETAERYGITPTPHTS